MTDLNKIFDFIQNSVNYKLNEIRLKIDIFNKTLKKQTI